MRWPACLTLHCVATACHRPVHSPSRRASPGCQELTRRQRRASLAAAAAASEEDDEEEQGAGAMQVDAPPSSSSASDDHSLDHMDHMDHIAAAQQLQLQQAADEAAARLAEGRRKRRWASSEHQEAASAPPPGPAGPPSGAPHDAAGGQHAGRHVLAQQPGTAGAAAANIMFHWEHGFSSGLRAGDLLGRHVRVWVARQRRWLQGCVVAYSAHTVSWASCQHGCWGAGLGALLAGVLPSSYRRL